MQTDFILLRDQLEGFLLSIKGEKEKNSATEKNLKFTRALEGEETNFLFTLIGIANDQNVPQLENLTRFKSIKPETTSKEIELITLDKFSKENETVINKEAKPLNDYRESNLRINACSGGNAISPIMVLKQVLGLQKSEEVIEQVGVTSSESPRATDSFEELGADFLKVNGKPQSPDQSSEKAALVEEGWFFEKDRLSNLRTGLQDVSEGRMYKGMIDRAERHLPVEGYLLGSGFNDSRLRVFIDEATRGAKDGLNKKNFLCKSDLNFHEAKELKKSLTTSLKTGRLHPGIGLDPQYIKAMNMKTGFFDRNFSPNEAVRIESDIQGNAFLFTNSHSSERSLLETDVLINETDTTQKPFQTEVLKQIVERAVLNLNGNKKEIKINLKPEFLGHLKMKISTENHQVMVRILTEIPMVKEIIESNISQLKTALENNGLEVDRFDVFVAPDSGQNCSEDETPLCLKSEGETDEEEADGALVEKSEEPDKFLEQEEGANLVDFFA